MEKNELAYEVMKADKTQIWMTFLLLGWSYGSIGQMGKQVLFYLTLGGLGLWTLYVLFTLNKKINKFNADLALNLDK
tara:strand:- start:1040 stop:1270 length:231 start_codon:yes stop_codon:yes gene_type:complete